MTPSPLLDLSDLVVAVTGAGGNIGSGIARRLSEAGARVLAHARSSPVDALLESLPGPGAAVHCDLGDEDAPQAVLAAAVEHFGRLDALVNNAGIQPVAGLREMSGQDF